MGLVLDEKEKLLCRYYAEVGNITEAAVLAGYSPEEAFAKGSEILTRSSAMRLVKRQRKLTGGGIDEIRSALRRIIFGQANDAVGAVISESGENCGTDFFSVSEIKRVKGGGVEVKLVDKLDALRLYYELECRAETLGRSESFFSALAKTECPSSEGDDIPE